MGNRPTNPASYRFGNFELNARSGELRKNGTRVRLQDQPLQILLLLLDNAGEVVTREQIQRKLWASDTFVDFDNAINSAMRRLREALSDDAGDPRFIETMARRGYRFIGNIEAPPTLPEVRASPPEPTAPITAKKSHTGLVAAVCAAVLVLGAIAIAGRWLWQHPSAESKPVQLTPVPLTAAVGIESGPSFSPDGNAVAYSWDGGDGQEFFHIYVKSIGSGKALRLTTGATRDVYPAWSPDGKSIAFVRYLNPTSQLYVVPALGGTETKVTEGFLCYPTTQRPLRLSAPAWSPDNKSLVVPVSTSPDFHQTSLFLVRVENGERLRLTTPPDAEAADHFPVFSPDGRLLVFARCLGDTRCGLYLLNLGQGYRPVGEPSLLGMTTDLGGLGLAGAAWTADGSALIYSVRAGRNQRLMRVQAKAGAEPKRLVFAGDHAEYPAPARQANRLAYMQVLREPHIWQIEPGKPVRTFAASTRPDYSPQYSPDGRRVAFASSRSGLAQIWTCEEDGGDPQQLTNFEGTEAGSPSWSPDGRWIAFDRRLAEGYRVFVMSADGGQIHRLTTGQDGESRPSWSRDGRWIYYACNRTGRYEVWKAPAQGGSGTQVTHNGGGNPSESHDGQLLYYTKVNPRSGLWVLPIQGGEEREVLKSVWNRSFALVADGIYYVPVPTDHGPTSVRFHPFATGQDTEIARVNENMSGDVLRVSPDRKKLLLSGSERTGSNIMIVDNFR